MWFCTSPHDTIPKDKRDWTRLSEFVKFIQSSFNFQKEFASSNRTCSEARRCIYHCYVLHWYCGFYSGRYNGKLEQMFSIKLLFPFRVGWHYFWTQRKSLTIWTWRPIRSPYHMPLPLCSSLRLLISLASQNQ